MKNKPNYEKLCKFSAFRGKENLFGIKELSPFSYVKAIPEQVPFNYMHLVLQVHCRWLLKQYFENKNSECFIGIFIKI